MLGFSRQEQRFVIFLLVAFIVGIGIQYYNKRQPNNISEEWAVEYEKIIKDFQEKSHEMGSENIRINLDSISNQKGLSFTEKQKFVGKININSASLEELQILTGIGPATALKIIEFRQNNGFFDNIQAIQKVKGIGPKKFEKIKSNITIE